MRPVVKPPRWWDKYWQRPADEVIAPAGEPYLYRWHLFKSRWLNIYLHLFVHSDDDRALHDHPWANASILLEGEYIEHTQPDKYTFVETWRRAGDFVIRKATMAHRIELVGEHCWTLFITGPKVREWGFHCPQGWVHWSKFVDSRDSGKIGPGCGAPAP